MSALSSSEQVFWHLRGKFGVDAAGNTSPFALFVYAMVGQDRIDSIDHVSVLSGEASSAADTEGWFSAKPPQYFFEKERIANLWFLDVARDLLREEIEQSRQTAIRETIGDLRRFWPGFLVGNLAGVTSNFLFAILIVMFLAIVDTNFSVVDWAKRLLGSH